LFLQAIFLHCPAEVRQKKYSKADADDPTLIERIQLICLLTKIALRVALSLQLRIARIATSRAVTDPKDQQPAL
jgi:hypothetical protein